MDSSGGIWRKPRAEIKRGQEKPSENKGKQQSANQAGTITLPIGHSAMPASFTCAHANGMPIMVTASAIAVTMCPSAPGCVKI
jgi:hypothetical protein